jgi:hypothetical protein
MLHEYDIPYLGGGAGHLRDLSESFPFRRGFLERELCLGSGSLHGFDVSCVNTQASKEQQNVSWL